MRLKAAARHFDQLTCTDAYTSGSPFLAQFDLFDDARRDSLNVQRRIVSVAPPILPPTRRVFAVADAEGPTQQWIVGEVTTDFFRKEAIRRKWICQRALGLASFYSFAGLLGGTATATAYGGRAWVKGSKEVEISSGLYNVWDLYFASTESASDLVLLDGTYFLKRTTYDTEGGFLAFQVDELIDPLVTVTLTNRTYAPVTDTWSTITDTVPGLLIRWQSHFRYFAQFDQKYLPGDAHLIVTQADVTTLKAGDRVSFNGKAHTVLTPYVDGAVWSAHVRPA